MKRELNFSKELVNSLPNKERTVIIYYYALGLSIHAIAVDMGIGDSRVYQLRAKGLKRLELMSQRLYIVIEQNEWPDGFYVTANQRFGDLPTAMRYISEMRKIYINLANEQGRKITQDDWETEQYSIMCDDKGWKQSLYIKENKSGE